MANKKVTTSKTTALELAKQRHMPVREFLNQEPTRSNLLAGLVEEKGEGNELTLLKELLARKKPISINDMHKDYSMPKATVSNAAKEIDEYLKNTFSNTIEPLKAKRVKIGVSRKNIKEGLRKNRKGGLSVGYHFTCLDKAKNYLEGPATRNLFEGLWDDFIKDRLCKKLEQEAKSALSEKLEGHDDYQPLSMEIGSIQEKTQQNGIDARVNFETAQLNGHNRIWESFNINFLLESRGSHILSVDAGGGKTTFLRHLQIEFLRKTDIVPIFLDASIIEEWKLSDSHQLAEKLTEYFDLKIDRDRVISFFEKAFNKDIILLVDGLDQIRVGGSEYECLANHIFDLINDNVIIASRPTAVMNLQDEKKFAFLRLKPFDKNTQINYFGENYKRAKQLSVNAPVLIAIPMLAHMVRILIEEKKDEDIKNRAELYERFISYILTKYKHGAAKLDSDSRTQIRMSLGEIAYDALAEKKPHIQAIPLDYCYDNDRLPNHPAGRKGESLTKSGLVNLIIEPSLWENRSFLFFTHQSFQEYLAAEYAAKDDSRIQRLISEMWNLKWEEVIKFLTGIMGQEIIEKILSEKDNLIHSRLFFCAKLVQEAPDVSVRLKNTILQKLGELLREPVFSHDALECYACVDKTNTMNTLVNQLKDKDPDIRTAVLDALRYLIDIIDESIMAKIVAQLNDNDAGVRCSALSVLRKLKDKLDGIIIKEIISMLDDKNCEVRCSALSTLEDLGDMVDIEAINKVADQLEDKDSKVRTAALISLAGLKDRCDYEILTKITNKLEDKDPIVRNQALKLLNLLEDKIDDKIATKVAVKFLGNNLCIRSEASPVYNNTKESPNDQIVSAVVSRLENKDHNISSDAFWALSLLKKKIDTEILRKILDRREETRLDITFDTTSALGSAECADEKKTNSITDKFIDSDSSLRFDVISTLGVSKNGVVNELFKKVASKLENRSSHVRLEAIRALYALRAHKEKIGGDVMDRIIAGLQEKYHGTHLNTLVLIMHLEDIIDENAIVKIVEFFINTKNDHAYSILKRFYRNGRLERLK